ncbi:MAG: hypothetical protein ABIR06_22765 [Cyclobacteriaceae bacterium]
MYELYRKIFVWVNYERIITEKMMIVNSTKKGKQEDYFGFVFSYLLAFLLPKPILLSFNM